MFRPGLHIDLKMVKEESVKFWKFKESHLDILIYNETLVEVRDPLPALVHPGINMPCCLAQ